MPTTRTAELAKLGSALSGQRIRMLELIAGGAGRLTELGEALNLSTSGAHRHAERLLAAGVLCRRYSEDGKQGPLVLDKEALRELVQQAVTWTEELGEREVQDASP